MKPISRFLPAFLLALAAGQGQSVFDQIDSISKELEQISGLKFARKVPYAIIDKEQLRQFLDTRLDKMKPQDIRAEELTLKMLGLVPQNYDLRQQTVDLITEQAAAFYDYHKKKLFVIEGDTGDDQVVALVHE